MEQRQRRQWHALPAEEVLRALGSSQRGLDDDAAARLLEEHGENLLQAEEAPGLGTLALKQVASPLIYMLAAAAVVSVLAGHRVDAAVIGAVVLLNTVIGVAQEWRAEKALEALRAMSSPKARVLRDEQVRVIDAELVVPGDVLMLETGDRVAADGRLTHAAELRIDESALTGESDPVRKRVDPVPPETSMADRTCMVWMSSPVIGGRGRAVVVGTGMDTVMGDIAAGVQAGGREQTPLQKRLGRLGTAIGAAAIGVAVFIFGLGLLRGFEVVEMLLFAVAAAVSAIPEGLPAVISVVLAVGVRSMADRNAIVRRLPAVETLGSTTVVCSDKTGTITKNEMTVRRMWAGGRPFDATGEGYDPAGEVTARGAGPPPAEDPALAMLLEIGVVCNDAVHERADAGWRVEGDPMEGALLVVAAKAGLDVPALQRARPRTAEVPFSSERKFMATLNGIRGADGEAGADGGSTSPLTAEAEAVLYVKGAPDTLLRRCERIVRDGAEVDLSDELRDEVLRANEALAASALRVLAAAYARDPRPVGELDEGEVTGLTLVGMFGLLDPPRPEAVRAIAEAHAAGVRVVMITGDHASTAAAIAQRAGIGPADGAATLSGEELDAMEDDELARRAPEVAVYARVSPHHKLRVVRALKANGEIVAMTGDGVNDAPALHAADIGVAMGRTGTEVAKEASDMVLADDDFATIVAAMEEGRVIFANLRRVVFFLLTTNLGEVLTLTAALVVGLPLPLTAVMILWVNLVTDGVSTIPLGLEPKHGDVMRRPPRSPAEGVLDGRTLRRIVLLAPVIAVGTLGHFAYSLQHLPYEHARTVAFTTLVAFEWFRALSTRSQEHNLWEIGLFTNRWLLAGIGVAAALQVAVVHVPAAQEAFRTVALSPAEWLRALAVGSSVMVLDEALKVLVPSLKPGRGRNGADEAA
ncbi:MAG: HAD-IC family P-type ATPase [Coriobacteriia bacterium]|nr:HAD-IC family P-type ATPase [Coriobacteriia bacterium]